MTREEITKRIDKLETRRFYLAMKDMWNNSDYALEDKLCREIRALKAQLN